MGKEDGQARPLGIFVGKTDEVWQVKFRHHTGMEVNTKHVIDVRRKDGTITTAVIHITQQTGRWSWGYLVKSIRKKSAPKPATKPPPQRKKDHLAGLFGVVVKAFVKGWRKR